MLKTRSLCRSSAAVIGVLSWQAWALADPQGAAAAAPTPDPAAASPTQDGTFSSDAPPASLSEVLRSGAKADYDAGRLLSDSGDFAGASLKFQSAYQQSGDPRLLWNAAACERNLRHYANAIVLVRRFLGSSSPVITKEAQSRARAFLDAAEPLTAPLQVESNQPNSQVYVDEQSLGTPELLAGVRIDLGTHRVAVEAPGFERYTETLTVTSAAAVQVNAVLRPVSVARPAPARAPLRDIRATATHASALPVWAWVAGGCVMLAGIATASYFLFKPAPAPEPVPGSIGTLLRF